MHKYTRQYKQPPNYEEIKDIWLACKVGNIKDVQLMLSKNLHLLNRRDDFDSTPLQYAAHCGHIELVRYLCEKGARDEWSGRAQLNALSLPIRLIIKRYSEGKTVSDAEIHQVTRNFSDMHKRNNTKKNQTENEIVKDIIAFRCKSEKEEKIFKCNVVVLLCRWKKFAHKFLRKASITDIEQSLAENIAIIKDKGELVINVTDIRPHVLQNIVCYLCTGQLVRTQTGSFRTRCYFADIGIGSKVDEARLNDVIELLEACKKLELDELVEIIHEQVRARQLNVGVPLPAECPLVEKYKYKIGLENKEREEAKRQYSIDYATWVKNYKPPQPSYDRYLYDRDHPQPRVPYFEFYNTDSWLREEMDIMCDKMAAHNQEQFVKDMCRSFIVEKSDSTETIKLADSCPQEQARDLSMKSYLNLRLVPILHGEADELFVSQDETASEPEVTVLCNQDYLCWKLEYFKLAMYGSFAEAEQMRQEKSGIHTFKMYNCSDTALIKLIEYLYTNRCILDKTVAVEMLFLAMRMELYELQQQCQTFITDSVDSLDNPLEILLVSDLVGSKDMYKASLRLVVKHFQRKFKEIIANNVPKERAKQEIEQELKTSEVREEDIAIICKVLR
jgi:hypothetical protein